MDADQQGGRNGCSAEWARSELLLEVRRALRWATDDAFNLLLVFGVQLVAVFRFHQDGGILESGIFQASSIAFNDGWSQYRCHIYLQPNEDRIIMLKSFLNSMMVVSVRDGNFEMDSATLMRSRAALRCCPRRMCIRTMTYEWSSCKLFSISRGMAIPWFLSSWYMCCRRLWASR